MIIRHRYFKATIQINVSKRTIHKLTFLNAMPYSKIDLFFFFQNQPVPSEYFNQVLSSLHTCVLSISEQTKNKNHGCVVDSFHISGNFVQLALKETFVCME